MFLMKYLDSAKIEKQMKDEWYEKMQKKNTVHPLDPLLLRLSQGYTDLKDLSERLRLIFQVRKFPFFGIRFYFLH